jgi:hypothetical protein
VAHVQPRDDFDPLVDAVGLDVLERRITDGDGELPVAHEVSQDVVE